MGRTNGMITKKNEMKFTDGYLLKKGYNQFFGLNTPLPTRFKLNRSGVE